MAFKGALSSLMVKRLPSFSQPHLNPMLKEFLHKFKRRQRSSNRGGGDQRGTSYDPQSEIEKPGPFSDSPAPVSKSFPDGIEELYDCPNATVDVCFVHGLTGGRVSTWTASGMAEPWPKALLPDKLSGARILTYGYDAYVLRKSVASSNRLHNHATNLLNDLTTDRASRNALHRPLIFVAHSLGGLVTKEAISLSQNADPHLRGIFECTIGVAFMGTPHRGSWMADWAKFPASSFGLVKSTNKSLLKVLETDDQLLESVQNKFLSIIRRSRESGHGIEVTCFFEEMPLLGVGVIVSKQSASLDGYNSISIHANHSNMVKFRSTKDTGFKRLLGELTRWQRQASKEEQSRKMKTLSEDRYDQTRSKKANKFLKMLYTCPYSDRKDRNNIRVHGTCEWFTGHHLFRDWNQTQRSSLLWVSADPGCGKSVLAKYLIDDVLPTRNRTVCYFFFKDDFTDQKSATGAICAILRQLFLAKEHLLRQWILNKFDTDGDKFGQSFNNLWSTLTTIATYEDAGEIVCILDALDECWDDDRSQLIQAIIRFNITGTNGSKLKFLLTSRPYHHIRREFSALRNRLPTIHLSGEDEVEVKKISQEIDLVIDARVESISKERCLKLEERNFLQESLTSIPHRTYIWVVLVMDVITHTVGFTRGNVRKAIGTLPQTVNEAYNKILNRSLDKDRARRLLHTVTAAKRPLTLQEMSIAMAIEERHQSIKDIEEEMEPEERFRNTLRDLCGLFVVIVDTKIYLIHQTATEFLVKAKSLSSSPQNTSLEWEQSLRLEESNKVLAERCIWYLVSDFSKTSLDAFLDYSATYWIAHFQEASISSNDTLVESARYLCETKSEHGSAWSAIYERYNGLLKNAGPLHLASWFGLVAVVKLLLETGHVEVNLKDDDGQTPLSWAAQQGNEAVVKLLLETGHVEVNLKDDNGQTPLSWAAQHGNEAVVKLLLKTGQVDVESEDNYGETPLSLAELSGNWAVVELLRKYPNTTKD